MKWKKNQQRWKKNYNSDNASTKSVMPWIFSLEKVQQRHFKYVYIYIILLLLFSKSNITNNLLTEQTRFIRLLG